MSCFAVIVVAVAAAAAAADDDDDDDDGDDVVIVVITRRSSCRPISCASSRGSSVECDVRLQNDATRSDNINIQLLSTCIILCARPANCRTASKFGKVKPVMGGAIFRGRRNPRGRSLKRVIHG